MRKRVYLYVRSLWFWCRAIKLVLFKRHGARGGLRRLQIAFGCAHCYRVLVYGQHYRNSRVWRRSIAATERGR